VERAKELIAAGDFMQVQVGPAHQEALHRVAAVAVPGAALAQSQPVHVLLQLHRRTADGRDFHVVGASPEILVRQEQTPEGQKVTIRPLAGTRPRGATPEVDRAVEQELLATPRSAPST
jgi:anthranilate synthase component 1